MNSLSRSAKSLVVAVLVASLGRPAAAQPAATPQEVDAARAYFVQGNAAYEKKQWPEAEVAYLKAWEIAHSFDVAGNLGEVEYRLGKHREAARFLAYDLRHAPPSERPEQRQRTAHFLEEARTHVGSVRLHLNVPDPEVHVDGRVIERPDEPDEIFLDPGPHELRVTRAGYMAGTRQVVLIAGGAQDVAIELAPSAASVGPSAAWPAWPIYVGAGVAAVTAGVATGFLVGGEGKGNDADKALAKHATPCGPNGCADVVALRKQADSAYNASEALFVVAGAFAAATITYAIVKPSAKAPAVTGAPWLMVSPTGIGAGYVTSF